MAWFLAFVDDHAKLGFEDKPGLLTCLQKHKGREVVITIKRRQKRQSSQPMRYYRGVIVPAIAKASGVTDPDEYQHVHEGLAWKFLRIADGPMGEPRRRSTAKDDLSAEEMSTYISDVIQWAETSIPDCAIPRPEEIDFDRVVEQGEWT